MVLCVGESVAVTTITPGATALLSAYSCTIKDCNSISNFESISTTVSGCDDDDAVDVCFMAKASMTAIGTYHKIRTCTCQGVAKGSAQFKSGLNTYACPDSSGISPNTCSCVGAGGGCETDEDCTTDWGNSDQGFSTPSGYQVRRKGSCGNSCSCDKSPGSSSILQLPEYRCATTHYGTADCTIQFQQGVVGGILRPAGIYCSGCTACPNNGTCTAGNGTTPSCSAGYYRSGSAGSYECPRCPAIIDSATGRDIYTNSGLSTIARGTSSAGSTSSSRCYWGVGTYYDTAGTIDITSGTSYSTCGYDE